MSEMEMAGRLIREKIGSLMPVGAEKNQPGKMKWLRQWMSGAALWKAAGNEAFSACLKGDYAPLENLLDSGVPICGDLSVASLEAIRKTLDSLLDGSSPKGLAEKIAAAKMPLSSESPIDELDTFHALGLCENPLETLRQSAAARTNLRLAAHRIGREIEKEKKERKRREKSGEPEPYAEMRADIQILHRISMVLLASGEHGESLLKAFLKAGGRTGMGEELKESQGPLGGLILAAAFSLNPKDQRRDRWIAWGEELIEAGGDWKGAAQGIAIAEGLGRLQESLRLGSDSLASLLKLSEKLPKEERKMFGEELKKSSGESLRDLGERIRVEMEKESMELGVRAVGKPSGRRVPRL